MRLALHDLTIALLLVLPFLHAMEARRPSTASSLTLTGSSIRRRSSTRKTTPPIVEDENDNEGTEVLRPAHSGFLALPSLPKLPPLPQFARGDVSWVSTLTYTQAHPTNTTPDPDVLLHDPLEVSSTAFTSVPLTPYPEGPQYEESHSSRMSTSGLERLPTPNFSSTLHAGSVKSERFSFLSRGLSFLSLRAPSLNLGLRSFPGFRSARWSTARSDSGNSNGSTAKGESRKEPLSSDNGSLHRLPSNASCARGSLLSVAGSSIRTIDKFTHKWPQPASHWRGKLTPGMGLAAHLTLALERGEGLGFEGPDRWTGYKWCLLLSVASVFVYGGAGLVCAMLTWFRAWDHADVMYVADSDILILMTISGCILLLTALLGMTGTFLNSRPILAIYALLLWPGFISMVVIGYAAYKRSTFALDRKLNFSWSQWYTPLGRLIIQDSLRCCGYYSALHEGTPSSRCYPRTPLPGCKGTLYRFEARNLSAIWGAVFSLVPLHLLNITAALLCANHVTDTFGEGMTPKGYRLSRGDVLLDAERIKASSVGRPEMSRRNSSAVFREDRRGISEPSPMRSRLYYAIPSR